ncbi:MAG: hypothetical protein IGQ45_03135 [Cyanobacterium sp. T60_A2020_053]|nr:hypothetical protein [Cyanobacterium sp. T60_A2020_053]
MSSSDPSSTNDFDVNSALEDLENNLHRLKDRYKQIQEDQQRKQELITEKDTLIQQLKENNQNSLKSEIELIKKELDEIELRLESELFKWSSLSEPFWQIVRFGGAGIVIGWVLKSLIN